MKRFILNVHIYPGNFTKSGHYYLCNSKFIRIDTGYQKNYLFNLRLNDLYCRGHLIYDINEILSKSALTDSQIEKVMLRYSFSRNVIEEHKYDLIFPHL